MGEYKNLFIASLLLIAFVLVTTISYSLVEGYTLGESFFYALFTITTTGSPFSLPQTVLGKYISITMIVFGLGIFLYIVTLIAQFLVEGRVRDLLGSIRGELIKVRKEKDHTIVCGYGKVGKYVCEALKEKGEKYVIIDINPEITSKLLQQKEAVIQGDALAEDVLQKANITDARALAACLGSDADNLYLVMGAKDLSKKLVLAAEAHDELAIKRLHDVGTQVVVYPEVVGGRQMAEALLKVEEAHKLETVATPGHESAEDEPDYNEEA